MNLVKFDISSNLGWRRHLGIFDDVYINDPHEVAIIISALLIYTNFPTLVPTIILSIMTKRNCNIL